MELQERIAQASNRMLLARASRDIAERKARALEAQAQSEWLKVADLDRELEECHALLRHAHVQATVNEAAEQTRKAREDAEKAKKEAEELLEKAKGGGDAA